MAARKHEAEDAASVMLELARVSAAPDPRIGMLVGDRYRITRPIIEGGMSVLYLAEHVEIGRRVVVKILPGGNATENSVARFKREAVAASRLSSPHIVEVHDFGRLSDQSFYLVMEHLEGRDLSELLWRDGLPGPARTLDIVRQLALALDHAHGRGIVHRDLKPENVFVVRSPHYDDFIKVLDFGIARSYVDDANAVTGIGTVLGTPAYMAPEQALGVSSQIGPAADRWALAALALELLTGETPFPYEAPGRLLRALVEERPRTPSELGMQVEGLDALFTRAMAQDPGARFPSSAAFADALDQVVRDAGLDAIEPGPKSSLVRALRPSSERTAPRVSASMPALRRHPSRTGTLEEEGRAAELAPFPPDGWDPSRPIDLTQGAAPSQAPPRMATHAMPPPALAPNVQPSTTPRTSGAVHAAWLTLALAMFAAGWLAGALVGLPW